MELKPNVAAGVCDSREIAVVGHGDRPVAARDRLDPISMAHPDIEAIGQTSEEIVIAFGNSDSGRSVLSVSRALDRSALLVGDELHAVADIQDRNVGIAPPGR